MSSTALVTGGTSGIGRAVVGKLAQLGIHVLVVGRNGERGKKAVLSGPGRRSKRANSSVPPILILWQSPRSPPWAEKVISKHCFLQN
jgi:NAD(P)-dependent dehydrogenase (short-subunit alcohol dehydrogenase family)